MFEALVPGFEPMEPRSLKDVTAGVAWLELADPLVRARVEEAAALFPQRRPVDLPIPDVGAAFMREVVDVHRELYAEHGDLYGEDVSIKIERCLAVGDDEHRAAVETRRRYRKLAEDALSGCDVLITPTLPIVAPPTGIGDLGLRWRLTHFTLPFNALGWPALALPCGTAEDGLPASVQLVGRREADALVLAIGEALEQALSATPYRATTEPSEELDPPSETARIQ
jgi:aspartyl-tRNA(Asn)/glutamyl-tRNA(Gln) amidotransferase subunit A